MFCDLIYDRVFRLSLYFAQRTFLVKLKSQNYIDLFEIVFALLDVARIQHNLLRDWAKKLLNIYSIFFQKQFELTLIFCFFILQNQIPLSRIIFYLFEFVTVLVKSQRFINDCVLGGVNDRVENLLVEV